MPRNRRRRNWKGPAMGPTQRKTDRAPAPPDPDEYLKRSLRDLAGEMGEQAHGAAMGASLLRQRDAHPDAARFLDGLSQGMATAADRIRCALDADECPF